MWESPVIERNQLIVYRPRFLLPELTSLAYVLAPTSTSLVKIHSAVLRTLLSMCFLPRFEGLSPCLHCRGNDSMGIQTKRQSTKGAKRMGVSKSQPRKRVVSSRGGQRLVQSATEWRLC